MIVLLTPTKTCLYSVSQQNVDVTISLITATILVFGVTIHIAVVTILSPQQFLYADAIEKKTFCIGSKVIFFVGPDQVTVGLTYIFVGLHIFLQD